MEETALKELWRSYHQKVEESLVLNKKNADDISKIKVHTLLSSMQPLKVFTLVVGVMWAVVLSTITIMLSAFAYHKVSLFFLYSTAIQAIITILAIGIYIYQLHLIHQVEIDAPIVSTQAKLARLKTSTLWVARILMLQLPVWTTFHLSKNVIVNGHIAFLLVQGIVTLSFTYAALWLFFNIKYENRNKKWFRFIFNGKEWTPILKSMELLEQINAYKESDRSDKPMPQR